MCFKFTTRSRLRLEAEIADLETSANRSRLSAIGYWRKAGYEYSVMLRTPKDSRFYKDRELHMNINQSSAKDYTKLFEQQQMLIKQLKSRL